MTEEKIGAKRKGSDDGKQAKKLGMEAGSLISVKCCCATRKGEREEMQDSHVFVENFSSHIPFAVCPEIKRIMYFSVFDGHNGPQAANFAAENLHKNIAALFPNGTSFADVERGIKRCFVNAIQKTDTEFLAHAVKVKPSLRDGTTATCLLLINNTVYVANLGDSRAIICRFSNEENREVPLQLTTDHHPSLFDERMRIQKLGGSVKNGRIMGILEVSRSIGDGQYKNHGVICVPDVKKCKLTEQDRYVLVACDGIWKIWDNADVIAYIKDAKNRLRKCETVSQEGTQTEDLHMRVCDTLSAEAVKRGCGDNVTVLLIALNEW